MRSKCVVMFVFVLGGVRDGVGQSNNDERSDTVVNRSQKVEDGFMPLIDGKTLNGWQANENAESWSITDGFIVGQGKVSHLFYTGDRKPFKNFHLKYEARTSEGCNSGVYFHAQFESSTYPTKGFECQINNSYTSDRQFTSSLYNLIRVGEPAAKDNVWFLQEIIVNEKKVVLKVDGRVIVEYDEPSKPSKPLGEGTFALQVHGSGKRIEFRDLRVKRLKSSFSIRNAAED